MNGAVVADTNFRAPSVDGQNSMVDSDPILREPVKPPDGASMQALNDYYRRKKAWNEQQRHG
jgi:hypothetical protein